MSRILLVGPEKEIFKTLELSFSENGAATQWTDTAEKSLALVAEKKFDLVIIHEQVSDMTAKKLVENIITLNAMMNCVVLSAMPDEDFHEAYEGLGVLMRFPLIPGKAEVKKLQDHLARINRIAGQVNPLKGTGNK
jgi:DNA-binding NtrC family response regulator